MHMNFLSRLFQKKPDLKDRVSFDDQKIMRQMPDGRIESVRWDDLVEVGIVTTDEGPFTDDIFWILKGRSGNCAVPSEADGMKELLFRLQQLPGFNNDAVIEAAGSTSNASFQCWRRENAP